MVFQAHEWLAVGYAEAFFSTFRVLLQERGSRRSWELGELKPQGLEGEYVCPSPAQAETLRVLFEHMNRTCILLCSKVTLWQR